MPRRLAMIGFAVALILPGCRASEEPLPAVDRIELAFGDGLGGDGFDVVLNRDGSGTWRDKRLPEGIDAKAVRFAVSPRLVSEILEKLRPIQRHATPYSDEAVREAAERGCPGKYVTDMGGAFIRWSGPSKDSFALMDFGCEAERHRAANATLRAVADQLLTLRARRVTLARAERYFCGGETAQGVVEDYFADLRTALEEGRPPSYFNRYLAATVLVTNQGGHMARYDIDTVQNLAAPLLSIEDWKQIALRGTERLEDAGWRGCFFDAGKVVFEGSEQGFRLINFDASRPWQKGDVK